jgi:hypothetical protein
MSAETKAALDAAISNHFAEVMQGAMVSGYVMQIAGESLEDMDANQWSTLREASDEQPFLTTLGLCTYLARSLDAILTENEK